MRLIVAGTVTILAVLAMMVVQMCRGPYRQAKRDAPAIREAVVMSSRPIEVRPGNFPMDVPSYNQGPSRSLRFMNQIIVEHVHSWLKARTTLDGQDEAQRTIRSLARDLEAVEVLSRALMNLGTAIEYYGETQAEVRMMAIAVLLERARQGDLRFLESAMRGLVDELGQSSDQGRTKGRIHDLADLITAWIEVHSKERFKIDPGMLVRAFDFNDNHRTAIALAALLIYPDHAQDQRFITAFQEAWKRRNYEIH